MLKVSPRFTAIAALLVAVVLGGCNLRQGNVTNTPFPTPDIPRVKFVYPDNNSAVIEGTNLAVQVLAEDLGAGIARVELLVDDVSQGEGKPEIAPAVPAFSANIHWIANGVGLHSLTALAYREDGQASAPVTLVLNVIARPTETP